MQSTICCKKCFVLHRPPQVCSTGHYMYALQATTCILNRPLHAFSTGPSGTSTWDYDTTCFEFCCNPSWLHCQRTVQMKECNNWLTAVVVCNYSSLSSAFCLFTGTAKGTTFDLIFSTDNNINAAGFSATFEVHDGAHAEGTLTPHLDGYGKQTTAPLTKACSCHWQPVISVRYRVEDELALNGRESRSHSSGVCAHTATLRCLQWLVQTCCPHLYNSISSLLTAPCGDEEWTCF